MADVITNIRIVGKNCLFLDVVGMDEDDDRGAAVDVLEEYGFIPSKFCLSVQRTAGSTDVIDVNLEGSVDGRGADYASLIQVTGKDAWSEVVNKPVRFVRITCTTVGAGNTLDAHAVIST